MWELDKLNCDKTQIVTKLKLWQNSLKLWLNTQIVANTQTQIVTAQIVTKLQNWKLWQNSKTQYFDQTENSNCDQTQILTTQILT